MMTELTVDHFSDLTKCVRVSDYETMRFKRLIDMSVEVSVDDHITGTIRKLATYRSGRWNGYNPHNLSMMFSLFRKHKNLKPALIRFLSPNEHAYHITYFEKKFTCLRKRFHITFRRMSKLK